MPQPAAGPPPTVERRAIQQTTAGTKIETRADGKKIITGYAAVFYDPANPGTQFRLWRDTYERVDRHAFDRAIKEDDVVGLWDHRTDLPLGRNTAGTLTLSVDNIGLRYEIDPPDTQAGRDALVSIARGDVRGSSFGFRTLRESWTIETIQAEDRELEIRTLLEVRLLDVSPVTYPAYEATNGSLEIAQRSADQWRDAEQSKRRQQRTSDILRRLRLTR